MTDLIDRIIRGDDITVDELNGIYKEADNAGVLYYKMLTMVREQRSLAELPETLKQIIKSGAWKRWRWVGSSFGQKSLASYLTTPPPKGVGIKLDTVERLIAGDPDAEVLYRKAMTAPAHRTAGSNDNVITSTPKQGNTRAYTLDRLERERPDLFEKVKTKQLSANAAAIKAGFRKQPTPLDQLRKAWEKASASERKKFLKEVV